jgi:hypothetical protein
MVYDGVGRLNREELSDGEDGTDGVWWSKFCVPLLVTHARDYWWTLDSANAFVSLGLNSRGELVSSHGASRRRLGDNFTR